MYSACNFIAQIQPDIFAVAGPIASSVKCGPNFQAVCNVVITIVYARAGVYIGLVIQQYCDASFAQITNRCGVNGGSVFADVLATGSTFDLASYATAKEELSVNCELVPVATNCGNHTCKGQCNPGGQVPP